MAKSARAKCLKPHKAWKRNDPKSAYAVAEAARLQRLNARLQAKLVEEIVKENEEPASLTMDVDANGERQKQIFMLLGLIDQDDLHCNDGSSNAANIRGLLRLLGQGFDETVQL